MLFVTVTNLLLYSVWRSDVSSCISEPHVRHAVKLLGSYYEVRRVQINNPAIKMRIFRILYNDLSKENRLLNAPFATAGGLRDDVVYLFVCLSVCSSVSCELCYVIRYVAAPGGERGFFV